MCSQKISLCIEVIIIEIILLMKQPMFIEDFGVIFFFSQCFTCVNLFTPRNSPKRWVLQTR